MALTKEKLIKATDTILEEFRKQIFVKDDPDFVRLCIRSFISDRRYQLWVNSNIGHRYPSGQNNGQLLYGPPFFAEEEPEKGSEIYVCNLATDVSGSEMMALFQLIGKVHCIRLMMQFSGATRGFCYIKFINPEKARMAARLLNNFDYREGQVMKVHLSVDNCRLFIGNVPKMISMEEIEKTLYLRSKGVKDVKIYDAQDNKSLNRGYCFVDYEDHNAATQAKKNLIKFGIQEWSPNEISVDWAIPERELDSSILRKVKTVFMRNLTLRTSENSIRLKVSQYIDLRFVTKIKKFTYFAFVHFTTRNVAQACINLLNGGVIDGARISVTWAKPPVEVDEFYLMANLRGMEKSEVTESVEVAQVAPVAPIRPPPGFAAPAPEFRANPNLLAGKNFNIKKPNESRPAQGFMDCFRSAYMNAASLPTTSGDLIDFDQTATFHSKTTQSNSGGGLIDTATLQLLASEILNYRLQNPGWDTDL